MEHTAEVSQISVKLFLAFTNFSHLSIERQVRFGVIAKATGESSESSIVKSIQDVVRHLQDAPFCFDL